MMKPVKRLYLSTDEVHLADASLVLELNSCGRGFITAQTTTDYTGKLVRLDVGYPICCCAGLPGTWNARNLLKTVFSVCLCASWLAYLKGCGHVHFSIPLCAR
jgi:hypothetical protein